MFLTNTFGPWSLFHPRSDMQDYMLTKGAVFSDRPRTLPVRNISSSAYGPTWRVLRRNLASEVLHPSRVKSYGSGRKWVLKILIDHLQKDAESRIADGVQVMDHFKYAMFCLLVFMCFGEKYDEDRIKEIASVQRRLLLLIGSGRFDILGIFPRLGRLLFINRWKELLQMRKDQEETLMPLIKARLESANSGVGDQEIVSYVDTLMNIQLPEEDGKKENDGKLTHKEMRKLYDEIVAVVGPSPQPSQKGEEVESVINEEDLQKMPYLKAVVLEGLRRHPPGHFVLPHRVSKEVELQGYVIPEGATINFLVADMGWDPKVWDDPMEFKPERFLSNDGTNGVFDISGSKGIKMMPFGAGRRICPGSDLALLHLEYFVANLIWYFDWTTPDGYHVDLSEKNEFTFVMKKPLQTRITPRTEKLTT
ncbi:cytochrome P450 [Artemisia annua]|uniref:Cytochrome P450 n=1 Tax=Artemisia annua TaxID=35608 RepID=A0A2U1NS35_ARTAN|nr:cytochrome P450 [Artemisia annua]